MNRKHFIKRKAIPLVLVAATLATASPFAVQQVTKAWADTVVLPADCSGKFKGKYGYIDTSNLDTSNVTNMQNMFRDCYGSDDIDVSHFDTSKVQNFVAMFFGDYNLSNIDVSHFDTSKVQKFEGMFNGCSLLENIDVSNWNTSSATGEQGLRFLFYDCKRLKNIDVSHFDTSNVTDLSAMFGNCWALKNIDVSNWNTSNVNNIVYDNKGLFQNCYRLEKIDVSNWDMSKINNFSRMFMGCHRIKEITFPETFAPANVTDMLENCGRLRTADFSKCDLRKCNTGLNNMLYGCNSLEVLKLPKQELMPQGYYIGLPFTMIDKDGEIFTKDGNSALTKKHYPKDGILYSMAYDRYLRKYRGSNAKEITLSQEDLTNDKDPLNTSCGRMFEGMFEGCSNLETLDLSGIDMHLANSTDSYDYSLSDNRTSIDTSALIATDGMFEDCKNLKTLKLPVLSNMPGSSATHPINLPVEMYDSTGKTFTSVGKNNYPKDGVLYAENPEFKKFENKYANSDATSLDVSGVDISNATSLDGTFKNCKKLESLDLSSWNMSKVKSATDMLAGCDSLKELKLPTADKMPQTNIVLPKNMYDSSENTFASVNAKNYPTNGILSAEQPQNKDPKDAPANDEPKDTPNTPANENSSESRHTNTWFNANEDVIGGGLVVEIPAALNLEKADTTYTAKGSVSAKGNIPVTKNVTVSAPTQITYSNDDDAAVTVDASIAFGSDGTNTWTPQETRQGVKGDTVSHDIDVNVPIDSIKYIGHYTSIVDFNVSLN